MAGLYIHIPYCKQKCHYCDFHFSVSLRTKDSLLESLRTELLLRKEEINEPIETIYFGGGTPSILSIDDLSRLFDVITDHYKISTNPEITLEANPDDLSKTYLNGLKKSPINRLSIGVQSFYDADLQFMNRAHSADEALNSIKYAQDSGFSNISIDLIYGIPNLTQDKWQENISRFLSLQIPHLSSYALTVEPKTALDHFIKTQQINPLDENLAKQHFTMLVKTLVEHKYSHYELSNFAKESFLSKHNTSYWQGKSYLGIGPSAHSYHQNTRSWNVSNNTRYIKSIQAGILPSEKEILSTTDRYNEYLMTHLRTIWGIDTTTISQDFGKKYKAYLLERIKSHLSNHNLSIVGTQIRIRKEAFFISDGIIADLFWVD